MAEEVKESKAEGAFKTLIKRSTLANIIGGVIILAGLGYFIYSGDGESVKWVAAFGLGYLFKEVRKK